MRKQSVLVVEDEYGLRDMIRMYLEKKQYLVYATDSGETALALLDEHQPDLVLLDIEMPEMDGFEVCHHIRQNYSIPIIFLSVRRETIDKVKSLELGGDDYLTKPFDFEELEARIKANLRRTRLTDSANNLLIYDHLKIDIQNFRCFLYQVEVNLSKKEMELLILLAKNPKRVWSAEQLYDHIWGYESTGNMETIKVHISTLRRKLEEDPTKPVFIHTVRGFGYSFYK